MEAIMALPNKTGSQEVINFIWFLENKPTGGILSGVQKTIDTKSSSSLVIPLSVFSTQGNLVSSSFPLKK
jgi:hypothetical protein